MPFRRGFADVLDAFDQGRVHTQRFIKNAGTAHAMQWADPSFASGQPGYDARVGVPLQFTPAIAQGNDAIFFPQIPAGQERYLASATFWASQSGFNGEGSLVVFDLLGYYPLVDGDSTDEQVFNNTLTLPRYADGEGVGIVVVNHIAPQLQAGIMTLTYVDQSDTPGSVTVTVPAQGQNLVCSGQDAVSNNTATITLPLANGSRGVKRITGVTFTTAPGGLFCFYLVKLLATSTVTGDNQVATEKSFITQNGCRMPRIYDGAWLGWFDRIGNGVTRTLSWYGDLTFIWG
jgi:hypothetical protein